MDRAPLPDLNSLGREALLALVRAQQEEHASLIAAQDEAIRRLEAELEAHRQSLSEQADELHSRSERIEHLKLMVEKFRQMIFGRKSEKIVIQLQQLELQLEEEETMQAEAEAAVERVSPAQEPKPRTERKPLPEHLRREVVTHAPNGHCCPDCGSQLRQFGEDVSEQLEYVPESFKVIRHVRPKFCCTGCDRVVEAAAPSRPIERGLAGPSLLAHVIVSKYADHLPLYRQSEIYARQGVEIPRSTLAGWVGGASDLLALWWTRSRSMSSPAASCTPTIRRYRCSRPAAAGPRQAASGLMCATTVRPEKKRRRRFGSPTRKIEGRASARASEDVQGALQADAYAGLSSSVRRGIYTKPPAGLMRAVSSTRSMSSMPRRQPPKHWPDRSSLCDRRGDPRQDRRSTG